jgi:hypothetical protein
MDDELLLIHRICARVEKMLNLLQRIIQIWTFYVCITFISQLLIIDIFLKTKFEISKMFLLSSTTWG